MTVPYIFANQVGPIPLSELDANFAAVGGANADGVNALDYMSAAQITDIKAGTLTIDCTTQLNQWLAACSSNNPYGATKGILPAGRYKATSGKLVIPAQFITIEGDGQYASQINIAGSASGGMTSTAQPYLRPTFSNFSIVGDASSGVALDFSNVSGQVYNFEFRNLYLAGGQQALLAANLSTSTFDLFSGVLTNVVGLSYNSHVFHASIGPGVVWNGCYGLSAGANKALYRLAGSLNLVGCNGGNAPGYDYWGVFGNDTTSGDGFQGDFQNNDIPDINMIGCNIEYFGSLTAGIGEGLRVQYAFHNFNVIGGKIDRSSSAITNTAYSAGIHCRMGSNGGVAPVRLGFGNVYPSITAPSKSFLFADAGAYFVDTSNQLASSSITNYVRNSVTYPTTKETMVDDVTGGSAFAYSAFTTRRMSFQMVRYMEPAVLTPVGVAQAISVTGYTKVIVTPVAGASITTATFDATPYIDADYGRNGDLLIEAGNGNLTVNHSASGANTFRMAGAANVTMTTGQILRFCRSETSNQWIQV
jgi:hypothetical protein